MSTRHYWLMAVALLVAGCANDYSQFTFDAPARGGNSSVGGSANLPDGGASTAQAAAGQAATAAPDDTQSGDPPDPAAAGAAQTAASDAGVQ